MSASIFWEPANPNHKSIGAWAPSYFMEQMERAGLGLPCTVGKKDIPVLQGLAASINPGTEAPNPFQEIIDAIKKTDGDISLWAEH